MPPNLIEVSTKSVLLDALASLDLKLSVSQSVIHLFQISFKASASTGLSDYFDGNNPPNSI